MGLYPPLINDISTDLQNPPAFYYHAKEEPKRSWVYPQGQAAQQKEHYPQVRPLDGPPGISPQVVFEQVQELAKGQKDWTILFVDEKALRLEGMATTAILRFRDDFVIEVRTVGEGGDSAHAQVHMRSKSRLGRSDFGANAKRIVGFFNQIKDRLSKGQ
ncbi:MAG: DUF1499 domain-containing protein [Bdellovibrionaceae bacterium]|nr:DUF1499 domain-containing protein [Bdellovibrionales bacterium]MCB9084026.1 DUF1499 domain-containing protein [Pseudobdellovibrionaceae bacterium]